MASVFLIDDELHAVELLKDKLLAVTDYFDEIETFTNSTLAFHAIQEKNPDLIFTDIEMPTMQGVDLHQKIRDLNIPLIYVTAYSSYAYDAIKLQAFDYILKPVKEEDLKKAVDRFMESHSSENEGAITTSTRYSDIIKLQNNKITVNTNEATYFIVIGDIVKIEAESNYSKIYLKDDRQILVSKTLKYFEEQLDNMGFMRVNRSFLVNLNYVEGILNVDGGQLQLKYGNKLDISKSKIAELKTMFLS